MIMNNIVIILAGLIIFIMGSITGAIILFRIIKRRQKKKDDIRKRVDELKRYAKLVSGMDSTKRKSLQPTNRKKDESTMAMEGEKPKTRVSPPAPVQPTPKLEKTFTHKFFGSSLNIGDMKLFSGLNNQLHRLEITKDQLYIDNKPYIINQGDFERIKSLIRQSRI